MVQPSMIRKALFGSMVLVLACTDGPVAAGPGSPGGRLLEPTIPVDPVTRVHLTMTDGFVAPLIPEAAGAEMARRIAAAFATWEWSRGDQHVAQALDALTRLRASLRRAPGGSPTGVARAVSAMEDPEALLVQDVLGLVVDDAIEALLAVSPDGDSGS